MSALSIFLTTIEQNATSNLLGASLNTNHEDSVNIFDKSQHLQEVGDNVSLTYCDMNAEINQYHDITIRFSNLCRICGDSILDGIDIFAAKSTEIRLKEKINLHMPISIDVEDSMPRKICIDCYNKLEIIHALVAACLRTDMRLKRFLNIEEKAGYENKYNALVEQCSLEIAQEICIHDGTHSDSSSFTTNKIINSDLETGLTQNTDFENISKDVIPTEINTLIQTYRTINNKNNETIVAEISEIQGNKIQEQSHNILCLQCHTFYETQEMFNNHKAFCLKGESTSKHVTLSTIRKDQFLHKSKTCESIQSLHCTTSKQVYACQDDFNNHKYLHRNIAENFSKDSIKKCGHCKEVYHNKKDLLNHIVQFHEGKLLFKCTICEKTYEKWSSLDIHEATHRIDKPFLCDLCGKRFKHSNNLRGHKRIHLDESIKKRHVCEVCGSAFRSRFHLQEHMNQHNGNRPYPCELCGKAFYKRIQLRQHKLSHGSNKHACPICDATFNRRGNMITHLKRHNNGDATYTCSVCTYKCKSMSELKMHRKIHTEEEIINSIKQKCTDKTIWQCNICNKIFSKRTTLINHERAHGSNKLYVECNECGKKLASKSSLIYHKKSMHLKERPHMCHYCGESFVLKEARLVHERIHTGERPYVCTVCNMQYRCSSNLNQHMKIHTGLKPHKCHYCNKAFTRKGALTVHERTHTGVKPYPCDTCGRTFSQKNDMLKHAKTHNPKLMQCDQCNEIFKCKKDMLKHTSVHEQSVTAISDYVSSPSHILQSYAVITTPSEII